MSMAAYLTTKGLSVLNQVIASQGPLQITKAELGDGVVTGESACRARTSLASKICDATFAKAKYKGGEAILSVQYNNAGLSTGFFVNEIGIYAIDPSTGTSVLYCYATFGDKPDWIAPASSAGYVRTYDVNVIISNAASVNVNISPTAMVTVADFDMAMEVVSTALLAVATENDATARELKGNHTALVKTVSDNYDTLDGKIDDTKDDVEGDIDTALNTAKAYTDQANALINQALLAVLAQYDPLIRDLRARLATAEAQLAALVS